MKNRLIGVLALILLAALLCGCTPPWLETEITTPTAFTQKVLIEEYTGTWCGFCPDGAYRLQALVDAFPGLVFGAAYHEGDPMEVPEQSELASGIGGCSLFPTGAVNRKAFAGSATIIMSRGYWSAAVSQELAAPAACGLRLTSSVSGVNATIEASAGFAFKIADAVHLAVLVVEDNVTMTDSAYYQRNYLNDEPSSPFYHRGDPIPDYVHMHVVRDYVTPVFGDVIGAGSISAGSGISRSYTWRVPSGVKTQDLKVIAILNTVGASSTGKTVLNVQEAALGETQDWD